MGTIKQNQDLKTTWVVDTSNDTYILGPDADIETLNKIAIDVKEGANNNTLILKGEVTAEDASHVVRVAGNNTHIDVILGAHINGFGANVGLSASGSDFSLNNAGGITGSSSAVSVADYAQITNSGLMLSGQVGLMAGEGLDLTNSGRITGDAFGVLAEAEAAVIRNVKGGEITSDSVGVILTGDGTAIINNAGLIKAAVAVSDAEADTKLINSGKIVGDINLGGGDDIFNTRAGTFIGTVNGGDGNDTYIIGKSSTLIEEQPSFGFDKVKSTATYTLGDNLENLILQGEADIDGTGNGGNNRIMGNKGDNLLQGMDGDDYLGGGRGNDILIGGADEDMFEFNKNTGKDVVEDFVNGEDLIFSNFANDGPSIADLIENHAVQKNGGVMIAYGDDSIFLKGMQLNQLDESDFFQGL